MNEITLFLHNSGMAGLVIGACTFLIIGLFHPIVIKAYYYFGTRCWWWFLVLGILSGVGSIAVADVLVSTLLGVLAFSLLWSIKEIFEQRERVAKGWFPANPRRREQSAQPKQAAKC